jgi:hypothetical protein
LIKLAASHKTKVELEMFKPIIKYAVKDLVKGILTLTGTVS